MYQRILVPTNGSPTSDRALEEAIKLADNKSILRLLFVLEEILPIGGEGYEYINMSALRETARNTAEEMLELSAKKVRESAVRVEIRLLQESGQGIVDVIINESLDWYADLIVIGTHGRTGLTRLLLGSVAEGVVRQASMPVLLIRA